MKQPPSSPAARALAPEALHIGAGELQGPVDWAARRARVFDTLDEGVWERNLVTNVSWYSARFKAMLGFGPDELPDDRNVINARVHPDDYPRFLDEYEQGIRDLRPFRYEVRIMHRSGAYRWVRGRGRVWAGPDGRAALLVGVLSDVHPEKSAIEELQGMTQRFERAISASNEGLFERVVGSDEITLSDRFHQLLGFAPGELSARRSDFADRVHPQDRERFEAAVAEGIRRLGRWSVRYRLRCKDDSHRWFSEQGIADRDARGQVVISGMMADVHDQVLAEQTRSEAQATLEALVQERTARLEEALELAREQTALSQRANQAKSVFLANVSHELRTPLHGVLGMTELALRSATQPDQRRYLQVATQSAQSLLDIINDLLDVAKVEAGKLTLAQQPFDLADLLAGVFRALAPSLRGKAIAMRFDFLGRISRVVGDPSRVRQIVTNLLSNAIKFTQHGHVTLVGEVVPSGPTACEVRLHVSDSGEGMDEDVRRRAFEPFEQGDASAARRMGGTGLGLSIVRHLASLMNGEVHLESSPGQGTTFSVTLRLALDDAGYAQAPLDAGTGQVWLVSRKVARLPVDIAAWIAARCERLGWQAAVLPSVDAAIARAGTPNVAPPDCVVVLEAALVPQANLAVLRGSLPAGTRVKTLVRPDFKAPFRESDLRQLDIGIVLSPLTPFDLVCLLTDRHDGARQAPDAPPAPDADLQGREVLVVEDNPVNQIIIDEMLSRLGLRVHLSDSAQHAIDACAAGGIQLVLMDLQMPDMDGFEATRRLRRLQDEGTLAHFPIVALTAHALESDRQECLAAGMDDYLTKPVDFAALRATLLRVLRASNGR